MNVLKLERHFSTLLFIESAAPGVCYVTAADDDRLGLIVDGRPVILTLKQAHTIAKEIREVGAIYTGRGRLTDERGRRHL